MPTKKIKILIAEDEKPMARALELKLNKEGFDAHAVFNGEEVLEAVKKESYDLLLLDLIMPKKDGFSVLAALKELKNTMPVIVSSNLSQDEDMQRAHKMGAKDYFVKSNTPINEIVTRVKKALGL